MRAATVAALLAPGVLAGGSCRRPAGNAGSGNAGMVPGNFANPGANTVPAYVTHTWELVQPEAVMTSLASLAHVSPSAVALMPGVTLPGVLAGLLPTLSAPSGGYLTNPIPMPSGCSTLPWSIPSGAATSSAAGSSGSGAASSGAASTGATSSGASGSGSASGSSGATSTSAAASSGGASSSGTTLSTRTASGTSSAATSSSSASKSTSSASKSTSATPTSTQCTSPSARVEWRTLSSSEQKAYLDAMKCLMTTKARSGLPGTVTRWDDLVAVHQGLVNTIHDTGFFMPAHRHLVSIFEQELRAACKYDGQIPYWRETLDAGHFAEAPQFTAEYYGTAPDNVKKCTNDGVFAGLTCDIGPGQQDIKHCLSRDMNENLSRVVTQSFIDSCNSYNTYDQMCECQYKGVHGYVHDAIGGDMSDVATSPNDPIFWQHHCFIDLIWSDWQKANPKERTYEIGGYTTQACENSEGGAGCSLVGLNTVLHTYNFYPDVTVAQVMDTQGGLLCYYYE